MGCDDEGIVDYTQIPKELDRKYEELQSEGGGALRPTIIKPGNEWTKKSQKALLAAATTGSLSKADQKSHKEQAFELLDGLTRAGALSVDNASLHVVIGATHCFDQSLMDTVVQDNINPIAKVERSTLIMASTVHRTEAASLLAGGCLQSDEFLAALPAPVDA